MTETCLIPAFSKRDIFRLGAFSWAPHIFFKYPYFWPDSLNCPFPYQSYILSSNFSSIDNYLRDIGWWQLRCEIGTNSRVQTELCRGRDWRAAQATSPLSNFFHSSSLILWGYINLQYSTYSTSSIAYLTLICSTYSTSNILAAESQSVFSSVTLYAI